MSNYLLRFLAGAVIVNQSYMNIACMNLYNAKSDDLTAMPIAEFKASQQLATVNTIAAMSILGMVTLISVKWSNDKPDLTELGGICLLSSLILICAVIRHFQLRKSQDSNFAQQNLNIATDNDVKANYALIGISLTSALITGGAAFNMKKKADADDARNN